MKSFIVSALVLALARPAYAEPLPGEAINQIADQGFSHDEVVTTAAHLADRIGGRLTNSPAMRDAERWAQSQFRRWGLANVRAEPFKFGRGWWIEAATVRMVTPRPLALRSIPVAWTPATQGPLTSEIIVAPMAKERDMATWRGKLAGKIVLITYPAPAKDDTEAPFRRYTAGEIAKLDAVEQPQNDPQDEERRELRIRWMERLDRFLMDEGAVAWVKMSPRDNGLVHGTGYRYRTSDNPLLPGVEIAAEDYRRLARLATLGPVRLEINSKVHYADDDANAYNILADLTGTQPDAGYVMAGAHLDSWVAGDGATDNAAGSAIVMEAARILKAIGARPKRTIRFALWSGEEQGLLGSDAYIRAHLAERPLNADPAKAALGPDFNADTYPIRKLADYDKMAGYFNIDNGGGKLRGIYAEGNFAAVPMLRDWLSPFGGLDAAEVVASPTGGTDHASMVRVGLPAFQFIQDPLDYDSRTHHTDLDTFDHLRADDLRQSAVVLAAVLLSAANSPKPLPAKPLPSKPSPSDRFHYRDPARD